MLVSLMILVVLVILMILVNLVILVVTVSFIFDILELPAFQKYTMWWVLKAFCLCLCVSLCHCHCHPFPMVYNMWVFDNLMSASWMYSMQGCTHIYIPVHTRNDNWPTFRCLGGRWRWSQPPARPGTRTPTSPHTHRLQWGKGSLEIKGGWGQCT